MKDEEHYIQCACVRWFAYQYPQYSGLLFAVPNGGARSKAEAGKFKAEGVVAGVADLILLVPKRVKVLSAFPNEAWWHTIPALCIEMKTAKGRQSPEQKAWQAVVEAKGYQYAVCHSLDEFINTVNEYLKN